MFRDIGSGIVLCTSGISSSLSCCCGSTLKTRGMLLEFMHEPDRFDGSLSRIVDDEPVAALVV